MASLPSERKALLFTAGEVRLALRLAHIREIVEVAAGEEEVRARGEVLPSVFLAAALGLPGGRATYALLTEAAALRVDALHGIVDLAEAEVFQLPARTRLPSPSPFAGAVVCRGDVALELSPAALGGGALERAAELPLLAAPGEGPAEGPPAAGAGATGRAAGARASGPIDRELLFARGDRIFAAPLSLLVQVLEDPRIAPVPLAPASHVGLVYHGRAIHPVLDVAARYGATGGAPGRNVLLLDAGGAGVGVVADRVLGVGDGRTEALRPAWDALFGS